MADKWSKYQKCTLQVVTIGYIKEFIKQGTSGYLIQKSDGTEATVSTEYTDDTYCPTYGELTAGTVVQTSRTGSTGTGDRDGIYINPIHKGTNEAYADNQEVDRADLMVRYTRFSSIEITAEKTIMSECGDSTFLGNKITVKRYTYGIKDDCTSGITSTESISTSIAADSTSFHYVFGGPYAGQITTVGDWPNLRTEYSIGKNGTVTSDTRVDTIYGIYDSWRGHIYTGGNLQITQEGLTGQFEQVYGQWNAKRQYLEDVRASGTVETCQRTQYGAKLYIDIEYTSYYTWRDSCGVPGDSGMTMVTDTREHLLASSSYAYWPKVSCPTESSSASTAVTYNFTGGTAGGVNNIVGFPASSGITVTYTRRCNQECCNPTANDYRIVGSCPGDINISQCKGEAMFNIFGQMRCSSSDAWQDDYITVEATYQSGDGDFVTISQTDGGKGTKYEWDDNCEAFTERTATYNITWKTVPPEGSGYAPKSLGPCTVTFRQAMGKCPNCPCECDNIILVITSNH